MRGRHLRPDGLDNKGKGLDISVLKGPEVDTRPFPNDSTWNA